MDKEDIIALTSRDVEVDGGATSRHHYPVAYPSGNLSVDSGDRASRSASSTESSVEPPSSIDFKDGHLTIEELHNNRRHSGVMSAMTISLDPPSSIDFKDQHLTIEELHQRDLSQHSPGGSVTRAVRHEPDFGHHEPATVYARAVFPEEYDGVEPNDDCYSIPITNAVPVRPPRRKRKPSGEESTIEDGLTADDSEDSPEFSDEIENTKASRRRCSPCCWWIIGILAFLAGTTIGVVLGLIKLFPKDNQLENTIVPDPSYKDLTVTSSPTAEPTAQPTLSPSSSPSAAPLPTVAPSQTPSQPPTPPLLTAWEKVGQTLHGVGEGDEWGEYLEISANGTRLAVGCEQHGSLQGRVAVYDYDDDSQSWNQVGSDFVGSIIGGEAGKVALSADGTTLAVGSTNKNPANGDPAGYVKLFQYNGFSKDWEDYGPIIGGESINDRFGQSVALNADGTIVAAGGTGDDDKAKNAGQARIFQYDKQDGKWKQLGQDLDGPSEKDFFGYDVTLSADGMTVAGGAYGHSANGQRSGLVQVYTYNAEFSLWVKLGEDILGEAEEDQLGRSVSLSDNGRTIAMGSFQNSGNGEEAGRVRVFKYRDDKWVQMGQSIDGQEPGDKFGRSVSLSGDGFILAAGGYFNDGAGERSGHIRAFRYSTTKDEWEPIGSNIDGDAAGDWFGKQISLSKDGRTVASGGPFNDGPGGENSGNVKVYNLF